MPQSNLPRIVFSTLSRGTSKPIAIPVNLCRARGCQIPVEMESKIRYCKDCQRQMKEDKEWFKSPPA